MKSPLRCVPLSSLLKSKLPLTNRQITQAICDKRVVVTPRQAAFNRARTLSNNSCHVHYKMECCGQYATKTDFEYQVTRLVRNLKVSCPICRKNNPLTQAQLNCLSPFAFHMHWKCYNRTIKQEAIIYAPPAFIRCGCPCGAKIELLHFEEHIWHKTSSKMTCSCGKKYTLSDATLSQLDPVVRRKYQELVYWNKK